ncbi:MAG: hypothetical protein PF693_06815 [Spirochaetia bacterium]|nr:hypothetical protein [Spirochaetia bacterium]
MNLDKLKKAESDFLKTYPGGFTNPQMMELSKKHKPEKMAKWTLLTIIPAKL